MIAGQTRPSWRPKPPPEAKKCLPEVFAAFMGVQIAALAKRALLQARPSSMTLKDPSSDERPRLSNVIAESDQLSVSYAGA